MIPATQQLYAGAHWFSRDPVQDLALWIELDVVPAEVRDAVRPLLRKSPSRLVGCLTDLVSRREPQAEPPVLEARLALYGAALGSDVCLRVAADFAIDQALRKDDPRRLEFALGLARLASLRRGPGRNVARSERTLPQAALEAGANALRDAGYFISGSNRTIPLLGAAIVREIEARFEECRDHGPALLAAYGLPEHDPQWLVDRLRTLKGFPEESRRRLAELSVELLLEIVARPEISQPGVSHLSGEPFELLSLLLAYHERLTQGWRGAQLAASLLLHSNAAGHASVVPGVILSWLAPGCSSRGGPLGPNQRGAVPPEEVGQRLQDESLRMTARLRHMRLRLGNSFLDDMETAEEEPLAPFDWLELLFLPHLIRDVRGCFEIWRADLSPEVQALTDEVFDRYLDAPFSVQCRKAGFACRKAADELVNPVDQSFVVAAACLHAMATLSDGRRPQDVPVMCRRLADGVADEGDKMKLLLAAIAWSTFAGGGSRYGLTLFPQVYHEIWCALRKDEAWSAPQLADGMRLDDVLRTGSPSPARVGEEQRSDLQHVVVKKVGSGGRNTSEIQREFAQVAGVALPLVATPDLPGVFRALRAEAPHFASIIDLILRDTAASPHVRFRPSLLVGSPGIGKGRLSVGLGRKLGMPVRLIPCGGVADGSFGGTSRQWHTGRPSVPLGVIRETAVANPLLVLDEIEKVGQSRQNGNLLDVLLGMLEPENAGAFWDPYIEAPVDLSTVNWLLTANSVHTLHPALLDRCRVLFLPEPTPDDLPQLLPSVLKAVLSERGLDERWAPPLSADQVKLIEQVWNGGSIRRLKQTVAAVIDHLDHVNPN